MWSPPTGIKLRVGQQLVIFHPNRGQRFVAPWRRVTDKDRQQKLQKRIFR